MLLHIMVPLSAHVLPFTHKRHNMVYRFGDMEFADQLLQSKRLPLDLLPCLTLVIQLCHLSKRIIFI